MHLFFDGIADFGDPIVRIGIIRRVDVIDGEHGTVQLITVVIHPFADGCAGFRQLLVAAVDNYGGGGDGRDGFKAKEFGIRIGAVDSDADFNIHIVFLEAFVIENGTAEARRGTLNVHAVLGCFGVKLLPEQVFAVVAGNDAAERHHVHGGK